MNNMLKTGGVKKGEMMIFTSGLPSKFTIHDQAQVDGATWYTVSCAKQVSIWMREQSEELQQDNCDAKYDFGTMYSNMYDIHEKLYTLMALRWS